MVNINVEIKGDKETIRKLQKLGKNLGEWRPELVKVADFMENFFRNPVFETQGGVFGARWAALNPAYEFFKRKSFGGRGILEASGEMRGNWQKSVSNTSAVVANMSKKAPFHHYGTRHIEKRTMVRIDRQRQDHIVDIFKEGIIRKIREAAS